MIVVGVGARSGVPAAEIAEAVDAALASVGRDPGQVAALATLDRRAGEAGVRSMAASTGWRLLGFPAEALARVPAPSPSPAVRAATGTPSVAEAAALLAAGPGAVLLLPKRIAARVTVAIAEMRQAP